MLIEIPDTYKKFILEYDGYRKLFEAFAIYGDYWFKGLGPTREEAVKALAERVATGHHLGKLEPSRYLKGEFRNTLPPKGLNIEELDL